MGKMKMDQAGAGQAHRRAPWRCRVLICLFLQRGQGRGLTAGKERRRPMQFQHGRLNMWQYNGNPHLGNCGQKSATEDRRRKKKLNSAAHLQAPQQFRIST